MADAESLRHIAHSRTPFSAWLGVMLLFALFGGIVLAIIGPSPRGDAYEQKRAKAREEKVKAVHDEAKALTSYSWIDKANGSVRIPISHAMELTVAELSQKKPAAAGPIATPAIPQAPAAAPSVAASPHATSGGTPKPTSVAGPNSEAANQPAAAINPPPAPPGSQPGASPTPTPKPTHPPSPTPAPPQPAN